MTERDSSVWNGRTWAVFLAMLAVLAIVNWVHEILRRFEVYHTLHKLYPFYVAESIDKLGGAVLCAVAIWLLRGVGWKGLAGELGLAASPLRGLTFGFAATLPLLVGLGLTHGITPHMQPLTVIFLAVFSPIVEEIEYRGFGVRSLQCGTGWPFWAIVWPQSVLFGLSHVEKGQNLDEMAGLFLVTGVGGVVCGWLVYRWQSLWFPISLHIMMNLWWEVFSVSNTALGGWFPAALQASAILAAIAITLLCSGRRGPADRVSNYGGIST